MRMCLFALKNLNRNRRRTATMMAMIAVGTTALLLAGGYAAATFRGLRESTIRNSLGHLQIGGRGFRGEEERPLATGLADVTGVRRIVLQQPAVRAAAARIDFSGLASNGEKSVVFLGRAVEPQQEFEAAGFSLRLVAGRRLASAGEEEIVLAVGLAASLHARVGDATTLFSQTVDGALNGIDCRVVGIYTTGVREMDERALIVRLDTAQRLLSTARVSKLVVVLDDTAATSRVRDALEGAPAAARQPIEIATWSDLATFYHQVRGLYSAIFVFLGIINITLVIISSGNSMTMMVMERVREIGTLMALGTSRARILLMFIVEGLGLGMLGCGLGALVAWIGATVLTRAEIQLPPPPTFTSGIRLVIDVVPGLYVGVPGVMLSTLLVASILPASRAARLKIVDALGHI